MSKNDEEYVRKNFLQYFRKNKENLNFAQKIEKLYDWFTHGELDKKDKAVIVAALLYFINPFDVVPDLTPILGFMDDAGVVAMAFRYLVNRSLDKKK